MACRLIGAKPLSKPMLESYYFDPWEQKYWVYCNDFSTLFITAVATADQNMRAILGLEHWA